MRCSSIWTAILAGGVWFLSAGQLLAASTVQATVTAQFSVEQREGLLWLTVSSPQSPEPLRFILDTGANVSVLHLPTARRLALPLGKQVAVQGVSTKVIGYWPLQLEASAGQIPLPEKFLALDLSALGASCGVTVDGLIGADFFTDKIVRIDYVNSRVELLDRLPHASNLEPLALRQRHGAFLIPASIDAGRKQWFRLDTGCVSELQWVTKQGSERTAEARMSVGLARFAIEQGRSNVRLAGQDFPAVPTGFHREQIFKGEAGLIGNRLLAQFSAITLAPRHNKVILESVISNQ